MATYLSAAVVSLAEKKAGDAELLLSLGGLSLALMLLYVGQSLMSYRTEMYYFGLNYSYLRDLNRKSMVVDYALLQSPHGQNMRSLADGNVDADDTYGSSNAALLPWRLLNLFSSVFGVFSFAAILSVLNPLLILLLAATTLVPYLTTQRYNKQRHEHREEEIVLGRQFNYIGMNMSNRDKAKDILFYRMTGWFLDVFRDTIGKLIK